MGGKCSHEILHYTLELLIWTLQKMDNLPRVDKLFSPMPSVSYILPLFKEVITSEKWTQSPHNISTVYSLVPRSSMLEFFVVLSQHVQKTSNLNQIAGLCACVDLCKDCDVNT